MTPHDERREAQVPTAKQDVPWTIQVCPEHGYRPDDRTYTTCEQAVEFRTPSGRQGIRMCGLELQDVEVKLVHTQPGVD